MSPQRTLLLILTALLVAPMAHAAGDGHGFDLSIHGFYVVDFVAYLALMGLLFRKPAKNFLASRYETARQEMSEATSLKETAQERLDKYEGLLENLSDEISQLETEFREDGEGEKRRIAEATATAAEKMRQEGARTLAREQGALRGEMEHELALRALERAEALIIERLDASTHQRLNRTFIDHLEERTDLDSAAGR